MLPNNGNQQTSMDLDLNTNNDYLAQNVNMGFPMALNNAELNMFVQNMMDMSMDNMQQGQPTNNTSNGQDPMNQMTMQADMFNYNMNMMQPQTFGPVNSTMFNNNYPNMSMPMGNMMQYDPRATQSMPQQPTVNQSAYLMPQQSSGQAGMSNPMGNMANNMYYSNPQQQDVLNSFTDGFLALQPQ